MFGNNSDTEHPKMKESSKRKIPKTVVESTTSCQEKEGKLGKQKQNVPEDVATWKWETYR